MATVNNRAVIETCLDITSGLIGLCLVIPSLFFSVSYDQTER